MFIIELPWRTPSKKNSKQISLNRRTGQRFIRSSDDYTEWHTNALKLLRIKYPVREAINHAVQIHIEFTFGDKRRCDLTNKAESVMDLLVDAGILTDDSWQFVPRVTLEAIYEKGVYSAKAFIQAV